MTAKTVLFKQHGLYLCGRSSGRTDNLDYDPGATMAEIEQYSQ